MSASAEILSEYLVKIGIVDDEKGRKQTQQNLEKIENALGKLAKRTVIAGASFAGMAVVMSNKLGSIEQQARRLNTSAGSLHALGQGFKSLGMDADKARSQISTLYDLLNGSGGDAYAKAIKDAFKVDVRDADGKMRDMSLIYKDIVRAMEGGRVAERERAMKWLGFDLDTANSAIAGELSAAFEAAEKRQRELAPNYKQQAREAEKLHKELDELSNTFGLLSQNLAAQLTPNATRVVKVTKDATEVLAKLLDNVLNPISNLIADSAEDTQKKVRDSGAKTAGGKAWAFFMPRGVLAQADPQPQGVAIPTVSDSPKTRGERNNNPGNIRKGEDGYRVFSSPQEGLDAMGYLLGKYRNEGWVTISDIVSRWAPKKGKDKNNTAAYIADVAQKMSIGAHDKITLQDSVEIARLMKAMVSHETGRNIYADEMYLRGAQFAIAEKGGLGTWTFNPTTKIQITVNGATDPKRTADQVGKAVDRAMSDSYANLRVENAMSDDVISFGGTNYGKRGD